MNNRPHLPHQWNSHNSFRSAYVCYLWKCLCTEEEEKQIWNALINWVSWRPCARRLHAQRTYRSPCILLSNRKNHRLINTESNYLLHIYLLKEGKNALQILDIVAWQQLNNVVGGSTKWARAGDRHYRVKIANSYAQPNWTRNLFVVYNSQARNLQTHTWRIGRPTVAASNFVLSFGKKIICGFLNLCMREIGRPSKRPMMTIYHYFSDFVITIFVRF